MDEEEGLPDGGTMHFQYVITTTTTTTTTAITTTTSPATSPPATSPAPTVGETFPELTQTHSDSVTAAPNSTTSSTLGNVEGVSTTETSGESVVPEGETGKRQEEEGIEGPTAGMLETSLDSDKALLFLDLSARAASVPGEELGEVSPFFTRTVYAFDSPIDRKKAFGAEAVLQKRVCYCADASSCQTSHLVDIGEVKVVGEEVSLRKRLVLPRATGMDGWERECLFVFAARRLEGRVSPYAFAKPGARLRSACPVALERPFECRETCPRRL